MTSLEVAAMASVDVKEAEAKALPTVEANEEGEGVLDEEVVVLRTDFHGEEEDETEGEREALEEDREDNLHLLLNDSGEVECELEEDD